MALSLAWRRAGGRGLSGGCVRGRRPRGAGAGAELVGRGLVSAISPSSARRILAEHPTKPICSRAANSEHLSSAGKIILAPGLRSGR